MDRYTVIQLREIAKQRGLSGYSKLRKAELIAKLNQKTNLKLRMNTDFIPYFERFLRPGIKFDAHAESHINTLFNKLAVRMQNTDFVESLRYLGEAALEAAQEQRFTNSRIEGVKSLDISNMILYIASELIDLSNYAAIDKKRDRILLSDIERVIKNDEDLDIAFS
jgi:hypothetical protein